MEGVIEMILMVIAVLAVVTVAVIVVLVIVFYLSSRTFARKRISCQN